MWEPRDERGGREHLEMRRGRNDRISREVMGSIVYPLDVIPHYIAIGFGDIKAVQSQVDMEGSGVTGRLHFGSRAR